MRSGLQPRQQHRPWCGAAPNTCTQFCVHGLDELRASIIVVAASYKTSRMVSISVSRFESLAQDAELTAEAEVCSCQVKMARTAETCCRQISH